ncbi:hypothetical protein BDV59DRAFT_186311 [Aspergillus ambiguus]|uniref:uncharacterized protein n=1 Tax=Aspergillus ambiguus TaxID=176160 RepID=UPI003CCDC51D
MKRLGFGIDSEDVNPPRWADTGGWRQSQGEQSSLASTSLDFETSQGIVSGVGDVSPSQWFEDLLMQNLVNGLDCGWFNLPGP